MKRYFHLLALTAIVFSITARGDTISTAGSRVIENPVSDGDLKMRVNDGGVRKDAIAITGSTAGVTLGAATVDNRNGAIHTVNGSFAAGNATSTDSSAVLIIGSNFNADNSFVSGAQRTNATSGGTGISLSNRTNDANGAIQFFANKAGDATGTNAPRIAYITQNGTMALGGTSSASTNVFSTFLTLGATADNGATLNSAKPYAYQFKVGEGDINGYDMVLNEMLNNSSSTERMRFGRGGQVVTFGATSGANITALVRGGNAATSTSSDFPLQVQNLNSTTAGGLVIFKRADNTTVGSISQTGATTTAFNTSSDERLKDHIEDFTGALAIVNRMRPRHFQWKEDGTEDYGVIAQEMKWVWPYVVTGKPDDDPRVAPMQVDYGKLTPVALAAIKELSAKLDVLQADYDAYKTAHP